MTRTIFGSSSPRCASVNGDTLWTMGRGSAENEGLDLGHVHARNSSRVAARLLRVVEPKTSARKGKVGPYPFTGFVTDALGLCALALVHAPEALPAIERALKRAREKK